jgi:hypothetical protein
MARRHETITASNGAVPSLEDVDPAPAPPIIGPTPEKGVGNFGGGHRCVRLFP